MTQGIDTVYMIIGKLSVPNSVLTDTERKIIIKFMNDCIAMLDETDDDDFFGTEGWRRRAGYDQ